jgi:hypothetical protein
MKCRRRCASVLLNSGPRARQFLMIAGQVPFASIPVVAEATRPSALSQMFCQSMMSNVCVCSKYEVTVCVKSKNAKRSRCVLDECFSMLCGLGLVSDNVSAIVY